MNTSEIKGISFPFRIGGRGGVVMSGSDISTQRHIQENIMSICGVTHGERVMQRTFGLEDLDNFLADLNETTKNMAIFKIKEALALWEPRIAVTSVDITEQEVETGMAHVVTIMYTVLQDNSTNSVAVQISTN